MSGVESGGAPVDGRDDGASHAEAAVRAATATLHALPLDDVRLAPPLDVVVADAPAAPTLESALEPAPSAGARRRAAGSTGTARPAGPPRLPTRAPTVAGALADLAAGRTSCRALVEASLEAAAANAELGAVVALDEEAARAEAEVLDAERRQGRLRGPLHGVPVTVKDVIDVAGLPTRAGSEAYDEAPKEDARAVARLREAGALVLAKVATHEFALGVATPQCRNPHDPSRLSGGSSGGSAIAVATGIGLASIGTDTRASLRVPSSLCGVVGFKASWGAVPTDGIVPLSWTVDHVGPIARDVTDAALLLESLTGRPLAPAVPEGRPLVIGVATEALADADREVTAACEAALGLLEAAGCHVVELEAPSVADLELANDLGLLVSRAEAACYHRGRQTDLARCIPEVRGQLTAALAVPAVDYLDAQRQRHALTARTMAAFARCDVVASPTTPLVAPSRDDYERYLLRLSRNTILWSLAGCPAASLPCGASPDGLPVGLQLAARPGAEQAIVEAGRLLEALLEGTDPDVAGAGTGPR